MTKQAIPEFEPPQPLRPSPHRPFPFPNPQIAKKPPTQPYLRLFISENWN
jgi:hypothetical protein